MALSNSRNLKTRRPLTTIAEVSEELDAPKSKKSRSNPIEFNRLPQNIQNNIFQAILREDALIRHESVVANKLFQKASNGEKLLMFSSVSQFQAEKRILYAFERERKFLLTRNPLQFHEATLSEKNRAAAVDWMGNAVYVLELKEDTFYTAVKILDYWLTQVNPPIDRRKYFVSAAASLWLASKIRDLRCAVPSIHEVANEVTQFLPSEVCDIERQILTKYEYDINFPIAIDFFHRFAERLKLGEEVQLVAKYALEASLFHSNLSIVRESCLAAAAIKLGLFLMEPSRQWTEVSSFLTGSYSKAELEPIISCIRRKAFRTAINCGIRKRYELQLAEVDALEVTAPQFRNLD